MLKAIVACILLVGCATPPSFDESTIPRGDEWVYQVVQHFDGQRTEFEWRLAFDVAPLLTRDGSISTAHRAQTEWNDYRITLWIGPDYRLLRGDALCVDYENRGGCIQEQINWELHGLIAPLGIGWNFLDSREVHPFVPVDLRGSNPISVEWFNFSWFALAPFDDVASFEYGSGPMPLRGWAESSNYDGVENFVPARLEFSLVERGPEWWLVEVPERRVLVADWVDSQEEMFPVEFWDRRPPNGSNPLSAYRDYSLANLPGGATEADVDCMMLMSSALASSSQMIDPFELYRGFTAHFSWQLKGDEFVYHQIYLEEGPAGDSWGTLIDQRTSKEYIGCGGGSPSPAITDDEFLELSWTKPKLFGRSPVAYERLRTAPFEPWHKGGDHLSVDWGCIDSNVCTSGPFLEIDAHTGWLSLLQDWWMDEFLANETTYALPWPTL